MVLGGRLPDEQKRIDEAYNDGSVQRYKSLPAKSAKGGRSHYREAAAN
jgi:hypothetical protein